MSKLKKSFPLIAALIFAAALFVPCIDVLCVSSRKNPLEKVYSRKAARSFALSYTHSVNKGRVRDFYRFSLAGTVLLVKTAFVSYGAGIPEPEDLGGNASGAVFSVSPDAYEISGMDFEISRLVMANGVTANHAIEVKGSRFFLNDYFLPQTSLVFERRRVSFIQYCTTRRFH
ncbi:MAG: DUF1850 domain-containing protein [Treponema sp.]